MQKGKNDATRRNPQLSNTSCPHAKPDFSWEDYDALVTQIEANVASDACLNIGYSLDYNLKTFDLAVRPEVKDTVKQYLAQLGYKAYEIVPNEEAGFPVTLLIFDRYEGMDDAALVALKQGIAANISPDACPPNTTDKVHYPDTYELTVSLEYKDRVIAFLKARNASPHEVVPDDPSDIEGR